MDFFWNFLLFELQSHIFWSFWKKTLFLILQTTRINKNIGIILEKSRFSALKNATENWFSKKLCGITRNTLYLPKNQKNRKSDNYSSSWTDFSTRKMTTFGWIWSPKIHQELQKSRNCSSSRGSRMSPKNRNFKKKSKMT